MRARLLIVVLIALGTTAAQGPPRRPARKVSALEREARAYLETMNALLQPVSTVASESAWAAATDVTPEHTGERAGAEKTAAALSGSRLIIERTRGFLASPSWTS